MTTDKSGWIPHNGGPCQIPNAKAGEFELRWYDGKSGKTITDAVSYGWGHDYVPYDPFAIIAYRVRLPADDLLRQAIEALRELTEACVEDFGDDEDYGDGDEPVGGGRKEDGTPDPMAITFGHIRKARAVLTAYDKREPRASPQPSATRSQIDE